MNFPAFTDDAYWAEIIEQYIQNNNKHPGWYNIEYYMWEYASSFEYLLGSLLLMFLPPQVI